MRLKSAYFKSLAGVFRGSGKKEIYIDFTKCRHNIILITGRNGAGKSTIFNALNFLPDNHNMYIPGEPGEKIIEYFDNDIIYRFRILYPVTSSGSRGQTKAFFSKIINGEEIELNPNGNIGSYKDLIFTELNLDPSFVSLSQLSSDNRGLADKNPAERKKFVSNIIEYIEVYNNIYKSLTKKASILKSMINNIVAKIDTIGNEEQLKSSLESIKIRIKELNDRKEALQRQLSENEAKIKLTDPDGSIQSSYNSLYKELERVKEDIDMNNILLQNISSNEYTDSLDMSIENYNKVRDKIYRIELSIENEKSKLNDYLISREEDAKVIKLKNDRLNSLKSEFNYEELLNNIKLLKSNIDRYMRIFNEIGIENFSSITKDEYITGLNILNDIKDQLITIRSYHNMDDISEAIDCILDGRNILKETECIVNNKDKLMDILLDKKEELLMYESLLDKCSILKDRPSNCNIDVCGFIKDALEAKAKNPEDNINRLLKEIDDIQNNIKHHISELNRLNNIQQIIQSINLITRNISTNSSILNKLPIGGIFTDIKVFLDKFKYGDKFTEINELYKYIDFANIFEEYKNDIELLNKLEPELKLYNSKKEIIDELEKELLELNEKTSNIMKVIYSIHENIDKLNKDKDRYSSLLKDIESAIDIFKRNKELNSNKNDIEMRLSNIVNNMKIIEESIININHINSEILNINNELNPIMDEKDGIVYLLTQLKDYNEELAVYKNKYELVSLIRKYSSPTKGGIQNIFMSVYMNKTLAFANQLLSTLFSGELQLMPYVINDKEFRIPVQDLTSSLINDDISSCSSGQIAMISMILSFSLLHQSSTKYNILKLDEIDSVLDSSNRSNFLIVLNKIMSYLNVENCILISHSSEMDLSNVDIISLNPVGEIPEGNVIFTY